MRGRRPSELKVAMVEPVGAHGGMNYYDAGLCEGLSKAGVRVTLYTCDETACGVAAPYKVRLAYRRIYGNDPAWLRGARYVRGSLRALLGAKLSRARITHFHLFHVGPLELFNVLLAKLLRFKVIITAHDVQSFVERLSVPWMVRSAYRASDRVIVHNEVGDRELRVLLGEHEARIDKIPHGNYLRFIREVPTREEAQARLGLPDGAQMLLFFGQIKRVKGLDVLLRAMPRILRGHPNTVLVIAGKVWKDDFDYYQKLIDTSGISANCVTHIRFIPDFEVHNYYAAAHLVVLPYQRIYQSGVLLMAMSYAKPVVVSDIEGMTEVVADGVNGYVFPSGDAEALADKLIEAMSNPKEAQRLGERALSYVRKHHDWDEVGRMTAACYRSVLEGDDG